MKILFLGANPAGTSQLALTQEVQTIKQHLRSSPHGSRFQVEQEWAVKLSDLNAALLRHEPDIVHFSGHGSRAGALILETESGAAARPPVRDWIDRDPSQIRRSARAEYDHSSGHFGAEHQAGTSAERIRGADQRRLGGLVTLRTRTDWIGGSTPFKSRIGDQQTSWLPPRSRRFTYLHPKAMSSTFA